MRKVFSTTAVFLTGGAVGYIAKLYHDNTNVLKANAITYNNNNLPIAFPIPNYQAPTKSGLKVYKNFVVSYNRMTRNPDWVIEFLTPELIGPPAENSDFRKDLSFEYDETESPLFRSLPNDYTNSGYDRGHLAAAGNYKRDPEDCRRSFVMTNVCPQVGEGFNRGVWNQLESYTRALVRRNEFAVVCTGPLYLPRVVGSKKMVQYEVIGNNSIAVPTHFFKVILVKEPNQNSFQLYSFVLPNQAVAKDTKLNLFHVPLVDIERAAGFFIFSPILNYLHMTLINNTRYS